MAKTDLGATVSLNAREFIEGMRKMQEGVCGFDDSMKASLKSLKTFADDAKAFGLVKGAIGAAKTALATFEKIMSPIVSFEKQMSVLKAVSGETAESIKQFAADAQRLGSISAYSAIEVAGLQTELSKIGKDRTEIDFMTKSVLDFAAAAETDVSSAASVLATTMNVFKADFSESAKYADILSKALAITALNFEDLRVAFQYAAPAAQTVGMNIAELSGLLGILTNNGTSASIAGTGLRRVLSELAERGLQARTIDEFNESLEKVIGSGYDIASAFKELGQRGGSIGLLFAKNSEEAKKLATEFQNANGAAEEMAYDMNNNVAGSIKRLSNEWENLLLVIGSTATGPVKGVLDWLDKTIEDIWKGLENGTDRLKRLTSEYKALYNEDLVESGEILKNRQKIKETYDYLTDSGMNAAKAEEIAIMGVTAEYEYQLRLQKEKNEELKKAADLAIEAAPKQIGGHATNSASDAASAAYAKGLAIENSLKTLIRAANNTNPETGQELKTVEGILNSLKQKAKDYKAAMDAALDVKDIEKYKKKLEEVTAEINRLNGKTEKRDSKIAEKEAAAAAKEAAAAAKRQEAARKKVEKEYQKGYLDKLGKFGKPPKQARDEFGGAITGEVSTWDIDKAKYDKSSVNYLEEEAGKLRVQALAELNDKLAAKYMQDAENYELAARRKMVTNSQLVESFTSSMSSIGNSLEGVASALKNSGSSEEDVAPLLAIASAMNIAAGAAMIYKAVTKSLTVWDAIAGVTAGVATVIAAVASIKNLGQYAEGGIVGGDSYTGDNMLARVNSGEMILTQQQQARMFGMLNGGGGSNAGGGYPQRIELVAQGSTLVGVLNNYQRKQSKI